MRYKRPKVSPETNFLVSLVLLRNDPALVTEITPHAEAGNPHAQYALGLIYAEGRGVATDPVQAYIWLSRAMAQGDVDAQLLRDMLLNSMHENELAKAEQYLANHSNS